AATPRFCWTASRGCRRRRRRRPTTAQRAGSGWWTPPRLPWRAPALVLSPALTSSPSPQRSQSSCREAPAGVCFWAGWTARPPTSTDPWTSQSPPTTSPYFSRSSATSVSTMSTWSPFQ
ncbi:hypothetical protein ACJX0J_007436, partial [Zea mays]